MKTYKHKIDAYMFNGVEYKYLCSSNAFRTCREFKTYLVTKYQSKAAMVGFDLNRLKVTFNKEGE